MWDVPEGVVGDGWLVGCGTWRCYVLLVSGFLLGECVESGSGSWSGDGRFRVFCFVSMSKVFSRWWMWVLEGAVGSRCGRVLVECMSRWGGMGS